MKPTKIYRFKKNIFTKSVEVVLQHFPTPMWGILHLFHWYKNMFVISIRIDLWKFGFEFHIDEKNN